MGWGIFKKIKDGLIKVGKKIWTGAKKVGNFLNDKIVKPLAPALSQAMMASGDPKMAAAGAGVLAGSKVFGNVMDAINRKGGT